MPQIFKRKGSPYYYARWQFKGKDWVVSTKERQRKNALDKLGGLMAEAKGTLQLNDQVARLVRLLDALPSEEQIEKRQDVVRRILGGQDRKMAIADGWESWRTHPNRKHDPKASTLAYYQTIWNRFKRWTESRRISYFHEVTREQAENYAADLWNAGISPRTYSYHLKFLRSAFGALEHKAGLIGNPWAHLRAKEKRRDIDEGRRNLSIEELKTVLRKAEGNLRVMIHVSLFTGLRLGDVVCLKWENIDRDPFKNEAMPGFIVVQPMKTSRTGKRVELPIHDVLRRVLEDHRKTAWNEQFLFAAERKTYLQNVSHLTTQIQKFFESCGIKTNEKSDSVHRKRAIVRVGFHSLRHSFVSLCAKAGAPQHVVQKLVGHGSPAMTEHYTHLDSEQKQKAIANLPDIGQS